MPNDKPIAKITNVSPKPFSKALQDAMRQSDALQAALELSNTSRKLSAISEQSAIIQAQTALGKISAVTDAINIAKSLTPFTLPKSAHISANTKKHISTVADVGIAVRNTRKSQNLTQQNFADLAGVGRRFLSELESGKPTLEIGKVLQVAAAAGLQFAIIKNSDE